MRSENQTDGNRSDEILAAIYADEKFMLGVRRAMAEIEAGNKGKHFRDLNRKTNV